MTVLELVRAATEHLAARGAETARLDAELLLGEALGKDRLQLYLAHDMPVDDGARSRFRALVRRRARGEPVAYLLGWREFQGLRFSVDRRCLVPRPETEHLVDEAVAWIKRHGLEHPRVADVGTGSGCIAISVAVACPGAVVEATDVSSEALDVARYNAGVLAPPGRVRFRAGDLLEPLAGEAPFDLLLSNPPYIATSEMPELPVDVAAYEPHLALDAGPDPIALHRRLITEGAILLATGGALMLELPDAGLDLLRSWLEARRDAWRWRAVRDLAGIDRVLVVEKTSES